MWVVPAAAGPECSPMRTSRHEPGWWRTLKARTELRMSRAMSEIWIAWSAHTLGIPPTTMYASPMVSTFCGKKVPVKERLQP